MYKNTNTKMYKNTNTKAYKNTNTLAFKIVSQVCLQICHQVGLYNIRLHPKGLHMRDDRCFQCILFHTNYKECTLNDGDISLTAIKGLF